MRLYCGQEGVDGQSGGLKHHSRQGGVRRKALIRLFSRLMRFLEQVPAHLEPVQPARRPLFLPEVVALNVGVRGGEQEAGEVRGRFSHGDTKLASRS